VVQGEELLQPGGCATAAGAWGLASGLAREFAGAGITVNTLAPSYAETPEIAAALAALVAAV
jgi:2,3-dihydroxy-2,3-dihydro-p-cumate dehydrogenase